MNVLYEYKEAFNYLILLPLAFILFALIVSFYCGEVYKGKINRPVFKRIVTAVIAFLCLIQAIILIVDHNWKKNINDIVEAKSYKEIEGYVSDFDPMPYEGHKQESFVLSNIKFNYSDDEYNVGYHTAASRGGVITGNGQHLKIRYVRQFGKNIIFYIEELQ